jgi:hypothetical protein
MLLKAQSFNQLDLLFQQKKYDELRQLVAGKTTDDPAITFFQTIFIENGTEAITRYETLFHKTDGRLKGLVAGKISEYYYARGFYVKAKEYSRFAVRDKPVEVKQPDIKKTYHIQVGAFGYKENAERMQELLAIREIRSSVKTRIVNGKTLYCVWIPGAETYRDTLNQARELKNKYKLNYQIINP